MLQCPLCPFADGDEFALALHVEVVHFAHDSQFALRKTIAEEASESNSRDFIIGSSKTIEESGQEICETDVSEDVLERSKKDEEYLPCPEHDCGEEVLWRDLQEHLDFHLAERLRLDDSSACSTLSSCSTLDPVEVPDKYSKTRKRRHVSSHSSSSKSSLTRRSAATTRAPGPSQQGARLGKAELGPYAFESRMPSWLRKLLLDGAKRTTTQCLAANGQLYTRTEIENEVLGIVPVIYRLLNDDNGVSEAWLCHSAVKHVFKLPKEGGFCGFRNIQMMLSFMLGNQWPGCQSLTKYISELNHKQEDVYERIPNVLQLQDMIERAWDLGFNPLSRAETGGIAGTRKYIGTPEVQALLKSFNIPHATFTCTDSIFAGKHPQQRHAHDQLLDQVQRYFSSFPRDEAPDANDGLARVHCTNLPPLFLQQPGHSLTIIGIEVQKDGSRNLLVFDPAFKPSVGIEKLLDKQQISIRQASPRKLHKHQAVLDPTRNDSRQVSSSSNVSPSILSWVTRANASDPTISGSSNLKGSKRSGRASEDKIPRSTYKTQSDSKQNHSTLLLEAYRRGSKRLSRHKEFEMLKLVRSLDNDGEDEA